MEKTLKILLGFSCNNNCIFCLDEKDRNIKSRATAEIINEIEESKKEGATDIIFTGGEPTIRQDIFELVSYAKKQGFKKIEIQTNGRMLYYRDFCEKLVSSGVNVFDIHIQGHTADLNNNMTRVKDSLIQTEAGIRNLKRLGQDVTATIVLNRYNFSFLEDMLSFAAMHKIKKVCIYPAGCSGENDPVRSNFLSEAERKRSEISKRFKDTDISWPLNHKPQKTGGEKNFKVVFVWFSYAPRPGMTASAPRTSTIYIAKVLEMHGFECVCVDVDMLKDISVSFFTGKNVKSSMNKLIGIVDGLNPDLVAVGSWSPSMPFAAEFIKLFKQRSEETMVALGGFNATILP
ncbi:MAG: radical SAM protein, partial [Candidatus Aenigmarchaeota archaeon]|nr:radical SAM protein [Candidatus Aenigmarchaeota archaeon]